MKHKGNEIFIGVDVGGTFTDFSISIPSEGQTILHKVASTPDRPERAIIDGITEILKKYDLSADNVKLVAHGTTVGTNALIQRKYGTVALVTSDGFRDLLEIGRQTRPKVYDIHLDHSTPLVERKNRHEVQQRRRADGTILKPIIQDEITKLGYRLTEEKIDCVVICFLHSYAFPEDENTVADLLRQVVPGHVPVITSSSVYPEFREYERFSTAVINGALLTLMRAYLDRLSSEVSDIGIQTEIKISQSSGGLMSVRMARQLPIRASLSGPAAGVLAAINRASSAGWEDIITLDVGGTSADVSLIRQAKPTQVTERNLAGFPIRIPALDVNAVGAGGGSIAWIDRDGLLKVGPYSAGASPGPACYDRGGEDATVTDANVLLGRLPGDSLLDGRMPINKSLSQKSVNRLSDELSLPMDETALGIVDVASATMVKAIRSISIERGHNPAEFALFVYGGAGPLHANTVARELDIHTIIVPSDPGILCADGAANSNLTTDFVKTLLVTLDLESREAFKVARQGLAMSCSQWFESEDLTEDQQTLAWSVDLRYVGQNYELTLPLLDGYLNDNVVRALTSQFHTAHDVNYGFSSIDQPIQMVSLKVKANGVLPVLPLPRLNHTKNDKPDSHRSVMFEIDRWENTPVFRRSELGGKQIIMGPAVIEQLDTTVLIYPDDKGIVDDWGNLIIEISNR